MTEITERNPYQIFADPKMPIAWETEFQKRYASSPKVLQSCRMEAWQIALELELPDRKDESWRWMDYKSLPFAQLETKENEVFSLQFQLMGLDENETSSSWANLPDDVIVCSLKSAAAKHADLLGHYLSGSTIVSEGKFAALAAAMAGDGLFVYVPTNTTIEELVKIRMNLALEKNIVWTHSVICLGKNAEASLELDWINNRTSSDGLHNGIVEVFLDEGARLHLDERQHFGKTSWNISHSTARLAKDAHLDWNLAVFGARSTKNFIKTDFYGKGSSAVVQGLMFPQLDQIVNLDTRQNHWEANTESNLLFKAVAANQGSSIWHGMIYVDPKAQQTDAYQSNKNLILDDSADVKSIPGLEIHADDVKCSHGATVGRIEDAELFYLSARGIPEKDAQKLIVGGFCNQILQSFKLESTRESLREMIIEKMERL